MKNSVKREIKRLKIKRTMALLVAAASLLLVGISALALFTDVMSLYWDTLLKLCLPVFGVVFYVQLYFAYDAHRMLRHKSRYKD